MNKKQIYFDNSATTKISKDVLDEMLPYLNEKYGNPSSIYSLGREAKDAIDLAREKVANTLDVILMKYISPTLVQNQITGRSKELLLLTKIKVNI